MDNRDIIIQPAGDRILIQTQELHDEYIKSGFHYNLNSTQALIDLIKVRGNKDNTFVFYLDKDDKPSIHVVLDDKVIKREQCTATYSFADSDLLKEWRQIWNAGLITQKNLITFLKRRDALVEFPEIDLLQSAVKHISMATVINYDSILENDNNFSISFKIKDGESSTQFPTDFEINIPLLNESDKIMTINVELEIKKPTGEGPIAAGFILKCPLLHRYLKEAVSYEVSKLKAALPGYNILAGSVFK